MRASARHVVDEVEEPPPRRAPSRRSDVAEKNRPRARARALPFRAIGLRTTPGRGGRARRRAGGGAGAGFAPRRHTSRPSARGNKGDLVEGRVEGLSPRTPAELALIKSARAAARSTVGLVEASGRALAAICANAGRAHTRRTAVAEVEVTLMAPATDGEADARARSPQVRVVAACFPCRKMRAGPAIQNFGEVVHAWLIASRTLPDRTSIAEARRSPRPAQLKGRTIVEGAVLLARPLEKSTSRVMEADVERGAGRAAFALGRRETPC